MHGSIFQVEMGSNHSPVVDSTSQEVNMKFCKHSGHSITLDGEVMHINEINRLRDPAL